MPVVMEYVLSITQSTHSNSKTQHYTSASQPKCMSNHKIDKRLCGVCFKDGIFELKLRIKDSPFPKQRPHDLFKLLQNDKQSRAKHNKTPFGSTFWGLLKMSSLLPHINAVRVFLNIQMVKIGMNMNFLPKFDKLVLIALVVPLGWN